MDNIKDDAYYVRKICDDLAFIVKHTEGIEITDLNENELLLDSMLFRLIQISENAKNLSEEYRNAHSEIPWTAIFGFRNRIVHDYGGVDLYVVYYTLKDDIPELLKTIKEDEPIGVQKVRYSMDNEKIVSKVVNEGEKPTKAQIEEIERAAAMPIIIDEDAPELSDEQYAEIKAKRNK